MCPLPLHWYLQLTLTANCIYTTGSSHYQCLPWTLVTGPTTSVNDPISPYRPCSPPLLLTKKHAPIKAVTSGLKWAITTLLRHNATVRPTLSILYHLSHDPGTIHLCFLTTSERLPLKENHPQRLQEVTELSHAWTPTDGYRNHRVWGKHVSTEGIQ